MIFVIRNNLHSKASAYTAHCCSNLASSDNSCSFPMKRYTCKPMKAEIIFSYLNISFMNPSLRSKCKSHSKLCNRLRRISWNSHHSYSQPVSLININIIKSCTPHKYQSDSIIIKNLQHICINNGINKCTHSVITFAVNRCSHIQISNHILNRYITKMPQRLIKRLLVVTFRIIKNNTHIICLLVIKDTYNMRIYLIIMY